MEKKPGQRFKEEREFNSKVQQVEEDVRLAEVAALGKFRREVIDLKLRDKTGLLAELNQDELNSTDLNFYRSFQRGELTVKDVDRQLAILSESIQEECAHSIKFLEYLKYMLTSGIFDRR